MNKPVDINLHRLLKAKKDIQAEYLRLVETRNYDPEELARLHERQWEAEQAYHRATRKVSA